MGNMKGKIMLSKHFSLEEMSYSRIAVEQAIDNEPPETEREAMQHLAIHLLEPLRLLYGAPIVILSGFRNRKVNRLAGGVVNSQHCRGEAADCYTPDVARLLTVLRSSGLVFDQAIYYCKRNFLHLSLKKSGVNRMQVSISGDYTRQQTQTVSTETKTQRISSGYIRPLLLIIGIGLAGAFFVYRTVS